MKLDAEQQEALETIADRVEAGERETIFAGLAGTGKTTVAGEFPSVLEGPHFCAYTGKAAKVLARKLNGVPSSTIHSLIYKPYETHCDNGCPRGVWLRLSIEERLQVISGKVEPPEELVPHMADAPRLGTRTLATEEWSERWPPCHRWGKNRVRCDECGVAFEKREPEELDPHIEVIVVDEASMVGEDVYGDLLSFRRPIVWVGDHGQLPPVKGGLNIMRRPHDAVLEEIRRTGEGSAIAILGKEVRATGRIPWGERGSEVRKVRDQPWGYEVREFLEGVPWDSELLILCSMNKTRVMMNARVRKSRGFNPDEPVIGDRVICLQNSRDEGLANGSTGTILNIGPSRDRRGRLLEHNLTWDASIELDHESGRVWEGRINREQFGEPSRLDEVPGFCWDYSYAMTTHKAQGSEAKRVVLLEEYIGWMSPEDQRRWLYTAVTRATSKLLVVKNR
jgi:ATP-dependent exoDNAse (exonuclease V), alpha subunit - helicase superfamily I member